VTGGQLSGCGIRDPGWSCAGRALVEGSTLESGAERIGRAVSDLICSDHQVGIDRRLS
jgi:hypothetical protein